MNQAIEANIVRPNLPEDRDRVEQLLVEFRAVQQRIHDLNQVGKAGERASQIVSYRCLLLVLYIQFRNRYTYTI